MATMPIEAFHSGNVQDGRVVVELKGINQRYYSFSMSPQVAILLKMALESQLNSLGPNLPGPTLAKISCQPIVGEGMTPGIVLGLGGNIEIALLIGLEGMASLKGCISHSEEMAKAAPGKH